MLDASAHFFRLPFSPSFFFRPESRYFFSVESTPENSRRHLVAELLITASLHVTRPIYVSLSLPLFYSLSFSLFSRCPASNFGVCTYGSCNRRIPRARLLDTNERNAAVCMVSPGERRRDASRRVASHRVDGTGFTGLHRRGSAVSRRTCWKTILRDSMKLLLSDRDSRPRDRIEFNSESCAGQIGPMFLA